MLRKDFFQAEIEKLGQVLARIIGLKRENNFDEAEDLISNTIENEFGLKWDEIAVMSSEDFEGVLKNKNFPAQKLDLLAGFIFEKASPFDHTSITIRALNHVLSIFGLLEKEHHTQSLDNLNKRKLIENFLNTAN